MTESPSSNPKRDRRLSSMRHQILGYMPANVIPAILSVVAVVVFTRLLSPAEFGVNNLGFSSVIFAQWSIYYPLQLTVIRMFPGALKERRETTLLFTLWSCVAAVSVLASIVFACLLLLLPLDRVTAAILWVALPLLLLRATVAISQAQNRAEGQVLTYVVTECANAIIGFVAGFALVRYFSPLGLSALLGLLCGATVAALVSCRRTLGLALGGSFDAALRRQMIGFALPLAAVYVVSSMLQYPDRFLVSIMSGNGALGVYAVAFSLVERPTTILCTLVSTATFPIAVRALENEGVEAARRQTARNGVALLTLAAPACVGLALSANPIAAVLVGELFRKSAAELIPPLAIAALLRNAGVHYIDHAFHLLRRPDLMLMIYGPAAAANVSLDLILIPRFGVLGAVSASLIVLGVTTLVSLAFAVEHFAFLLPYWEIARIVGAIVPMAVALALFHPAPTLLTLTEATLLGATIYGVAALALDAGKLRGRAEAWISAAIRPSRLPDGGGIRK